MIKRVLKMVCLGVLLSACEESTAVVDSGADLAVADAATGSDGGEADGGGDISMARDTSADITPPEGLFVHGAAGEDLPGKGTLAAPFKTIQFAIDQAQAPVSIHVAAGTYNEDVAMRDQVSLLGGYSATDWLDRDPRAWDDPVHRTAIHANIGIAVKAGKNVGGETLIEGFYLEGGIEHHDHHSHGMYIYDSATPVVRSNKIHGGFGDHFSTGITTVSDAAPTITRNLILGGEAPTTYALRLNETTALVASNLLSALSGSEEAYGVLVNNASPVVFNNTIDVGNAATAYGFFLFSTTAPEIANNIVVAAGAAKAYGIYEATISGDPAQVRNNDFFGCATAIYHDWGSSPADITDVAGLHALSDTTASGNVVVNPLFVSPTDRRLQPTSPVEVREGGLDQSALGLTADMDGKPRTVPWSMGAYEQD